MSRQAVSRWLEAGIPPGRVQAVADLAEATELLSRYVKREQIPAVVRRPSEALGGRSLYELALEGRHQEVHDAVARMFDLRRVQPRGPGASGAVPPLRTRGADTGEGRELA